VTWNDMSWHDRLRALRDGAFAVTIDTAISFAATGGTWGLSVMLGNMLSEIMIDLCGGKEKVSEEDQLMWRTIGQALALRIFGRIVGSAHGAIACTLESLVTGLQESLPERFAVKFKRIDSPVYREVLHSAATIGFAVGAYWKTADSIREVLEKTPRLTNVWTYVSGKAWAMSSAIVAGSATIAGYLAAGAAGGAKLTARAPCTLYDAWRWMCIRGEAGARATGRPDVLALGLLLPLMADPATGLLRDQGVKAISHVGGLIQGLKYYFLCLPWFQVQRILNPKTGAKVGAISDEAAKVLTKLGMHRTLKRMRDEITPENELAPFVSEFGEKLAQLGLFFLAQSVVLSSENEAAFKPTAEQIDQMLDAETSEKVWSVLVEIVVQFALIVLAKMMAVPEQDRADPAMAQRSRDMRRALAAVIGGVLEMGARLTSMTNAAGARGMLEATCAGVGVQAVAVAAEVLPALQAKYSAKPPKSAAPRLHEVVVVALSEAEKAAEEGSGEHLQAAVARLGSLSKKTSPSAGGNPPAESKSASADRCEDLRDWLDKSSRQWLDEAWDPFRTLGEVGLAICRRFRPASVADEDHKGSGPAAPPPQDKGEASPAGDGRDDKKTPEPRSKDEVDLLPRTPDVSGSRYVPQYAGEGKSPPGMRDDSRMRDDSKERPGFAAFEMHSPEPEAVRSGPPVSASHKRQPSISEFRASDPAARGIAPLDPQLAFLGSNPFRLGPATCTAGPVTDGWVTVTVEGQRYTRLGIVVNAYPDEGAYGVSAKNGVDWNYTLPVKALQGFFEREQDRMRRQFE
jgi:hypothetical protein